MVQVSERDPVATSHNESVVALPRDRTTRRPLYTDSYSARYTPLLHVFSVDLMQETPMMIQNFNKILAQIAAKLCG